MKWNGEFRAAFSVSDQSVRPVPSRLSMYVW